MSDFFLAEIQFNLLKLKAFNYAYSLDQNEYVKIHLKNYCVVVFLCESGRTVECMESLQHVFKDVWRRHKNPPENVFKSGAITRGNDVSRK